MIKFKEFITERKQNFYIVDWNLRNDNSIVMAKNKKEAIGKKKMAEYDISDLYQPQGVHYDDKDNFEPTEPEVIKEFDFEDLLTMFKNNNFPHRQLSGQLRYHWDIPSNTKIKKVWEHITTKTRHRVKIKRYMEEKNVDEMFDLFLNMEADNTFANLNIDPIEVTFIFNWVRTELMKA